MTPILKITGGLKKVKDGLVDYIASGEVIRNGKKIPCEIGFTIWGYTRNHPEERGEAEVEATHIFIKDGITSDGTHYNAETIEL